MEIIVVSDSHRKPNVLEKVLLYHPNADYYLHCGDIEADSSYYPQFLVVSGNNDLFLDYPNERVLSVLNHRIYMVHSHQFYYDRVHELVVRAKELECDIVCYGHTHVAFYEEIDGVHVLNPGSLYRSRDGRDTSYARILLDKENVNVEFMFLPHEGNDFFW